MEFNVKFYEDSATFKTDFNETQTTFDADFGEIHTIYSDKAVLYVPQSLTVEQQAQARENIGVGEADKFFQYTQYSASDTWTIEHNLGKYPSVSVVDSAGSVVVGEVLYLTMNTLQVRFTLPFSGKVYLN